MNRHHAHALLRLQQGADEPIDLPLVTCPQCGGVASIEWHTTIDQMLHLKVRCIQRHWFLLPADMVSSYPSVQGRPASSSSPPDEAIPQTT
jgi:hypothetical protein